MSTPVVASIGGPPEQVITALASLDLDLFPFSSFDSSGNLVSQPSVPADLRRELKEVLKAPDWKRVCKAVSLFDNPGHNAYALGFQLDSRGANIVAVRSTDTLSSPAKAKEWYFALAENILAGVQANAGKAYYVKPSWIEAVRKILSLISGQVEEAGARKLTVKRNRERLAALIDLRFAVEFVLGVLEVANLFGRKHSVSCVVVWQYSRWKPPLDKAKTAQWSAIGEVVNQQGRNVAGVLWDERNRTTWHWSEHKPWRGIRLSPSRIYRAWYPSGDLVTAEL